MFNINMELSPAYQMDAMDKKNLLISKIGEETYMVAEPVDEGVVADINLIFSHNDAEDKDMEDDRDYLIISDTVIYIENLADDLDCKLGITLDKESSEFWKKNAEFV